MQILISFEARNPNHFTIYCLKMEAKAEPGISKELKLSHWLEDPDLMAQQNLGFHDSLVR